MVAGGIKGQLRSFKVLGVFRHFKVFKELLGFVRGVRGFKGVVSYFLGCLMCFKGII